MGEKYSDRQTTPLIGDERFPGQNEPFKNPEAIRFAGFGADAADLERGFVEVTGVDRPESDLVNYKGRSTEPKVPEEENGDTSSMPADYEFRSKHRESRGMLTRPRIPTER